MTVALVVGSAVLAVALSALLWRVMAPVFAAPVLQRRNYADRPLPTAAGIVIVLTALALAAVGHVVVKVSSESLPLMQVSAWVQSGAWIALGFGFLGLLDDLLGEPVGTGGRRGFRGHVGAALHGEVTTGFVKLAGGVALAVLLTSSSFYDSGSGTAGGLVAWARSALLVAGTANLANLFDRAPGRVLKVSVLGVAVVLACGIALGEAAGLVIVVGAGLGLLGADLRERCMLGDTGANALGAVIGVGLVTALGATGEWVALAVVLGLNLVSERVSFSRVIAATPPLQWLDALGRRVP